MTWGMHVEGELAKVKGKKQSSVDARRKLRLGALLGANDEQPTRSRYADPASLLGVAQPALTSGDER